MCVEGGGREDKEICSGLILVPVSGSCPHLSSCLQSYLLQETDGVVGGVW